MVTLEYLFNTVNELYGNSKLTIHSLAEELGVTYTQARELTVAAGYHYHTQINPPVTLEEFEEKLAPQRIQMML